LPDSEQRAAQEDSEYQRYYRRDRVDGTAKGAASTERWVQRSLPGTTVIHCIRDNLNEFAEMNFERQTGPARWSGHVCNAIV